MFAPLSTYEWRPCTPPSTWADMVLFSNFSSPEYIIDKREGKARNKNPTTPTVTRTDSWHRCPGSHAECRQSGRE
uniref:Uncharacterized protein n=1 Tax=Denticeps clupeoides TaxID=299321 RepID=A0AAY4C4M7_9TELE